MLDKCDKFRDGHGLEINVIFHHDFGASRNDIIGSVFTFSDDFKEVFPREILPKDIMNLIRDFLLIKPFPHLAAGGAAWRSVNLDHSVVIILGLNFICTLLLPKVRIRFLFLQGQVKLKTMKHLEKAKIIFIDMDGTLLYGRSQIGKLSIEAIRKLNQQGHIVVLASGRPLRSMLPFYELLECNGPLICYNGALILDPKNSAFPCKSRLFQKEMLVDIAKKGEGYITSFMAENLEHIYASRIDPFLERYFWYKDMHLHIGDMKSIIDSDTYTALFRCVHKHDETLASLASSYPNIELHHWTHSFYSELSYADVNKGLGVKTIQEYYGCPKEDMIGFGDANNDAAMLHLVGTPFSMKGCRSSILAVSFPQTKKGNSQDGVAHELIRLFNL